LRFRRCQDILRAAGHHSNFGLFEKIARRCGSFTRRTELLHYSLFNPIHQPYIDALIKTTSHDKFAITLQETPFRYHRRIKMRRRAVEASLGMITIYKRWSSVIGSNGRDVMRLIGKCVLATWMDESAWAHLEYDNDKVSYTNNNKRRKV
jgi:hypothetical protein